MSISHLLKENDTLEIYTARSYLMYNLNKENVVGPRSYSNNSDDNP